MAGRLSYYRRYHLVEKYVNRALSTIYNASETQEVDEFINVHEPKDEVRKEVHEPEAEVKEEPTVQESEPEVLVCVPITGGTRAYYWWIIRCEHL